MENVTRELAPMLANLMPLESSRAALDLGGGPGNYALAFVRRWPELRVTHFDLPPTSRIAQTFVSGKEGADRIVFREGDFLVDSLGGPYEFVWASQIVHMVGDVQVQELLQRIAGVLRPGGRVAIHDQFLDDSRTSPRSAAMFGVHMLVATQGGRTYSFDEMERWSRRCGLIPEERVDYGGPSRILLARK
jgi:trans-aconitate methyltransferase